MPGISNAADFMTKFSDGKKFQELVQHKGKQTVHVEQIAVSAQSSAGWLESGGLGKAEHGDHQNRREHRSSRADSVIQSELRNSRVAHKWNTMKQQAVATAATAAAEGCAAKGQRSSRIRGKD